MSFVIAAVRNRTFLCAAIIVNAVAVMLADSAGIKWDLWDVCEVLLVLFVVAYLSVAEPDQEFRGLIRGMLFGLVSMTVVASGVREGDPYSPGDPEM
jgi:hypothetical protein